MTGAIGNIGNIWKQKWPKNLMVLALLPSYRCYQRFSSPCKNSVQSGWTRTSLNASRVKCCLGGNSGNIGDIRGIVGFALVTFWAKWKHFLGIGNRRRVGGGR